jgi:hypothetical protein
MERTAVAFAARRCGTLQYAAACLTVELPHQPSSCASPGCGSDRECHLVKRICHENLALAKRKSEGFGSSSLRGRRAAILQRFAGRGACRGKQDGAEG